MKWIAWIVVFSLMIACESDKSTYANIVTDFGTMKVRLYDSTPQHRDNFIKLANEGFYDSLLFHRVIPKFMIQAGDPDSKYASPEKMLGGGGPGYTIPAEIGAPHFKGALSAARIPDQFNPERASSGSQFFIIHGEKQSEQEVSNIERAKNIQYTPEQRELYKEIGGYPFLDTEYTVFGEVVEGMEVIDQIANLPTRQRSRPVEDVRIQTIEILD